LVYETKKKDLICFDKDGIAYELSYGEYVYRDDRTKTLEKRMEERRMSEKMNKSANILKMDKEINDAYDDEITNLLIKVDNERFNLNYKPYKGQEKDKESKEKGINQKKIIDETIQLYKDTEEAIRKAHQERKVALTKPIIVKKKEEEEAIGKAHQEMKVTVIKPIVVKKEEKNENKMRIEQNSNQRSVDEEKKIMEDNLKLSKLFNQIEEINIKIRNEKDERNNNSNNYDKGNCTTSQQI